MPSGTTVFLHNEMHAAVQANVSIVCGMYACGRVPDPAFYYDLLHLYTWQWHAFGLRAGIRSHPALIIGLSDALQN